MTSSNKCLLGFLTLAVLLHTILAEGFVNGSCYQCNSAVEYDGDDCIAEPTSAQFRKFNTPCPVGDGNIYTRCRKMVQEVEDLQTRVVRSCATASKTGGKYVNKCVDRTGTFRIKVRYCECENDDALNPCNEAISVTSSKMTFVLGSVVSAVSYYISHYILCRF